MKDLFFENVKFFSGGRLRGEKLEYFLVGVH